MYNTQERSQAPGINQVHRSGIEHDDHHNYPSGLSFGLGRRDETVCGSSSPQELHTLKPSVARSSMIFIAPV